MWERDAQGGGKGRVIDVNLVDSVFSLMEGMLPEYALDGRVRQPVGSGDPDGVPDQHLSLRRWQISVCRRQFRSDFRSPDDGDRTAGAGDGSRLCHQFPTLPKPGGARCRHRGVEPDLAGEGRRRTILERAEVPCSRLYDIADCATDPHFLARKAVLSIDDPLIGRTLHPGPAIRMDGEAPEDVVRWTGPEAGAHTDFVLHTLLGLARDGLSKTT